MIIIVGRSIVTKKGDGSQVKESTDSSTTLEDDDIKGKCLSPAILQLPPSVGQKHNLGGTDLVTNHS
jgi:hypothetical protein